MLGESEWYHRRPVFVAHFDGACEPVNPGGFGGWGFVIVSEAGEELVARAGLLPRGPSMTNNVAEYTGALECVRAWIELARAESLLVRGDSKLVIEQMSRRWQVKGGAYVPVYRELRALVDAHGLAVTWQWIPRDENARADELSKLELEKRGIPIARRRER